MERKPLPIGVDIFEKLISNYDMPFNEYIDDIKKIYNVEITSNDLLRISSFILNGHTKCTILNTNIIFVTTRKIEVNGKFEYPENAHNL